MKNLRYIFLSALIITLSACDKKNDNLVTPLVEADFPQILLLADEGDGELEDEDKFSFKITLADRVDPEGNELGGKIVPLAQDVKVNFEITDFEGFKSISSFILDAKAFYEIDDCTTSEDESIDLNLVYDVNTGKGSVTFPKGVEEIEIEFETDADLFDDDIFNSQARKLEIKLTGLDANGQNVVVNKDNVFEFMVLDDEGIYGEYELDINNQAEFEKYIQLFGLVNEDVKNLTAADVEEILVEFQYGEFKAIIVLKETEEIDECGEKETVNKEIEIEGEFEELEDDAQEGAVEFVGEVEQEDGSEKEFVYKGTFKIDGENLVLTLQGEFDDTETNDIILNLKK
ncbi:hypothetical protein [Pedobacter alpinus]|uniref:DUF4382 domain-containing protein n=1 Tax=Pedobacter alpinus TaxID=1590643 RepID=A0ABW5TUR0_9SPHI